MDTDGLLLLSAAELNDGTLVVASQEDGVDTGIEPHTVILSRDPDGEWTDCGAFARLTVDMCVNETGDGVVLVDNHGNVSDYFLPANRRQTAMYEPGAYESHQVRFLKNIGGAIYSGGTNRHLHVRDRGQHWTELSSETMRPDTEDPIGFESLDGFGPDELYAVGWSGALWTRAEGRWSEIDSPTNLILTTVTAGTDRLFAAGQLGTILEGRGNDWRIVEHDETDADIWAAASFGGATYFATGRAILKWEDGEISVAHHIDDTVRTAQDLKVGPSGLWSIGQQDLVLFDGEDWISVLQTELS